MDAWLSSILSYLLIYKYALAFLMAFGAGLILPLPVTIVTMAMGAFASQGYFGFSWSWLAVGGGNVLGDITGYWLARKYGYEVVHKFKADKSRYYLQMERYLAKHAGWTIFITRFAGSLDPIVNFLSGLAKISWKKFIFYDCLGNFLETGMVLQLGYLAGDYWGAYSYVLGLLEAAIVAGVLWSAAWNAYQRWKENASGLKQKIFTKIRKK